MIKNKWEGGFYMAQATFSVRMDEALKKQFDVLCQEFGMNASTAINVFARAVVRQRRIPFEISSPETDITREGAMQAFMALRAQAKENGISDMSLDDINKEISLARVEADK
jgi:addiction module RelB/DinJ family antitoxin